jgi:hypothetical protein
MGLEEQLLSASLLDTHHEAHKVLQYLYDHVPRAREELEDLPDEFVEYERLLVHFVEKAFRDVGILAERLGLLLHARKIAQDRKKIKHLGSTDVDTDADTFVSEALNVAWNHFESLRTMTQGRDITGLGVFENILQSAGNIFVTRNSEPANETEISNALREVLSYAFPGQVRVNPIEKTLKTYYPDIGITSLMAAAEVKFATKKEEAKAALDGIYADMKGYSGRDEWRSFYAVIYMTKPFYTQKDVEREFGLVKAEYSWTPYVVLGPGERKKKARS